MYEAQNSYKYIVYFEPVIHMQIYVTKLFEQRGNSWKCLMKFAPFLLMYEPFGCSVQGQLRSTVLNNFALPNNRMLISQ